MEVSEIGVSVGPLLVLSIVGSLETKVSQVDGLFDGCFLSVRL